MKKTIYTIAKKEFFGYINSPLAYTVTVPFLFISIFIFLRNILVSGDASMRGYFDLLPWFLILIAPALSMKLLSDEWKSQTVELIFAHPLREWEIVLGKFLGAWAFFGLILLATVSLPISILSYSNADWGQMVGQYLGAFLTGGMFIAIGIAASSIVKNTISSFLLATAASFILVIIGLDFISLLLPYPFNQVLVQLSVLTHTETLARGLLDLRDISYFITVIALFLYSAVSKLSQRMWEERPTQKAKLQATFLIMAGIGIALNIFLISVPVRFDITKNRLFTLSSGTKQIVKSLPDVISITFYTSLNLPGELSSTVRSVSDLLTDLTKISSKIKVETRHPDSDLTASQEAAQAGIREVTFNKIGTGKFEVQSGYLGLSIRYGDKTEAIPYIEDTADLEYQVVKRIKKLTSKEKAQIGMLRTGFNQNQAIDEVIATEYEAKEILAGEKDPIKDIAMLLVLDDGTLGATDSGRISDYLISGGKALIFTNGITVNQQMLTAEKAQSKINDTLKPFGVEISRDLVYDLRLGEIITLGQGNERYLAQYPYWFRSVPVEKNTIPPISGISALSVGWASSISLTPAADVTQNPLFTTGYIAGKSESLNIAPEMTRGLDANAKEPIIIAAFAEIKDKGKVIVVASELSSGDPFISNNRDNLAFMANSIDYLAAASDLAYIPNKAAGRPVLSFKSPIDLYFMQYGNLLAPPLIVIAFAAYWLRKRRLETTRTYEK
jgi:ABC-2 type transport system permease protein